MHLYPRKPGIKLTAIGLIVLSCAAARGSILTAGTYGESCSGSSLEQLEAELFGLGLKENATKEDAQSSGGMSRGISEDTRFDPFSSDDTKTPAHQFANFSPGSGNAGNATSSPNSVYGVGGSTPAVLYPLAEVASNSFPPERYAADRSLVLPESPGFELLRPPQI